MPKYRKKPVVIEAMQFTQETKDSVFFQFLERKGYPDFDVHGNPTLKIETLEGVMTTSLGDYVIRGVMGEFYPCKPDIFEATYEAVEDTQ